MPGFLQKEATVQKDNPEATDLHISHRQSGVSGGCREVRISRTKYLRDFWSSMERSPQVLAKELKKIIMNVEALISETILSKSHSER